jgi:hypothetical protein
MASPLPFKGQEFGIFHWQLSGMVHPPFAYVEMFNRIFRHRTGMSPCCEISDGRFAGLGLGYYGYSGVVWNGRWIDPCY